MKLICTAIAAAKAAYEKQPHRKTQ